jgi:hypothetical protein
MYLFGLIRPLHRHDTSTSQERSWLRGLSFEDSKEEEEDLLNLLDDVLTAVMTIVGSSIS